MHGIWYKTDADLYDENYKGIKRQNRWQGRDSYGVVWVLQKKKEYKKNKKMRIHILIQKAIFLNSISRANKNCEIRFLDLNFLKCVQTGIYFNEDHKGKF